MNGSPAPAQEDELLYDVTGDGIATITFNRPARLNALTSDMADRTLPRACRAATEDPNVRVVIVTGVGRGFCTGADVEERLAALTSSPTSTMLERPLGYFGVALWAIPKPVIAVVNGIAAGGGFGLATLADFRLVAATARFVPAFDRRGMMPDTGITHTLPRLVGRSHALRILMTGAEVGADEALKIGLADAVHPDGELPAAAAAFAAQLAAGPPVALSFTKRAIERSASATFTEQLEFESWGQTVCMKSRDYAEGIAAFRERRKPRFEGR